MGAVNANVEGEEQRQGWNASARVWRIYTSLNEAPPEIRTFGPHRVVQNRKFSLPEPAPEPVPIGCTDPKDKEFTVLLL